MPTKTKPGEDVTVPRVTSFTKQTYVYPTIANMKPYLPAPYKFPSRKSGADTIIYDNGRDRFNMCDHTKDNITSSDVPNVTFRIMGTGVNSDGTTWWSVRIAGYCEAYPFAPQAPTVYTVTDQMRRRAWHALKPQLNDGFSLFNFLWELKDFVHLYSTTKRLSKLVKKLDRAVIGGKTAAELHLSYQFGIKPLLSDLNQMIDGLFEVKKTTAEFIRKGKIPNNYHYSENLDESISNTPTSYGHIETQVKARYNATLRCVYSYDKPRFMKLAMRVTGLRLTPEHIWNAIPFSFLIDWVLKVNRSLRQLDEDPHLTVKIIDYCDSIKSESSNSLVRSELGTAWASYVYDVEDRYTPLWTWKRTKYTREPGLPDTGYAFPVWDSLSLRELVLSAALIRAN